MKKKKTKSLFEDDGVHETFHKFVKKFCEPIDHRPLQFKKQSYKLMVDVEIWAQKYPDEIEIVGCDDDYHTSSDLVFINHIYKKGKDKGKLWGTTVIYIPQCSPQPPSVFFLYPQHRKNLIEILNKIDKYKSPLD